MFIEAIKGIYKYEDEDKIEAAIAVIPLDELVNSAAVEPKEGEIGWDYCEEDRLIIHLLKWFKSWFSWVNAPDCENCRSQEFMSHVGRVKSNEEEAKFGADIAELWACSHCLDDSKQPMLTRFPRYQDCVKLLSYRKGRCGEWCNVMHLLLRALGRDTRFVWNSEDHVWNEIWSNDKNRWIHIDSCEAAFDNPLIYTDGWGKKMAYVLGYSVQGAKDITKRYVRRPEMALPRELVSEQDLQQRMASLTIAARQKLDPVDEVLLYERDIAENAELASYESANSFASKTAGLLPRQSGSLEWSRQRGEASEQ